MPPVQQVLEGLETQMMKQLQMNYGVCSDLMSMRAADAQTGTQKSIIHLLPLWLYPRRWGRSLFQLLTFTPKVNLGSLIQLPPPPLQVFGLREKAPQGHREDVQPQRTAPGLHRCAAVNRKITGINASQSRLQLQSVVEL